MNLKKKIINNITYFFSFSYLYTVVKEMSAGTLRNFNPYNYASSNLVDSGELGCCHLHFSG